MLHSAQICTLVCLVNAGLEVGGALSYRLLPCKCDDLDDICEPIGSVQPQETVGHSVAVVPVGLA